MQGPGYWMNETSGVLRPAVEAYLVGAALTGEQIAALRGYLRQWIGAPAWDRNPYAGEPERQWLAHMRAGVDQLTSRQAIDEWIEEASANGLDPL